MRMNPKSAFLAAASALVLAACASSQGVGPKPTGPSPSSPAPTPQPAPQPSRPSACGDCGTVVHIETVAAGKAQGAVLGGIVGSVASKPVSGDLDYNVHVRMDDGRRVVVRQEERGSLRLNSRVRVVNGRLVSL